MPDLSGRVLGDFELLRPIGHGGMAAVYEARHRTTGRIVALKILSPQAAENESFLLRFRREARVVQQLRHPNIVPVEAFGEQGDYAYLVMPYLRVGSLADRLAQGPLTPHEGSRIFSQVCRALDYAHQQGVVHRDVKPSNILLDEHGNALLADFGLAQIHDASISLTGSALLGTPAYVSPEQVRGEKVDARSDQYSLGIVLYQLTTGHLPYEAETPMAVLLKQVNEPMPRPRLVNANIPEPVERVILKATAKLPDERFESMEAFNAAFQAALAHALDPRANPAPAIALPASVTMTSEPKAARRRFRPWMAGAAFLVLLACPLAFAAARGGSALATSTPTTSPDPRLTDAAATIDALSTEIVAARAGPMTAGEVSTAAAATAQAAAAATGTVLPTQVPSPSDTPGATLPVDGATVTATSTASPSRTPTRTSTRSTGTVAVGSDTPSATIPTSTETPSATATIAAASPTPAPVDDTPTAKPLVCETSRLGGIGVNGTIVAVGLHNDGDTYIRVTGIELDWPVLNGGLQEIHLGPETIWSQGDLLPPTKVTSGWDSPNRTVLPGDAEPLAFVFQLPAKASGYALSVELNHECRLTGRS